MEFFASRKGEFDVEMGGAGCNFLLLYIAITFTLCVCVCDIIQHCHWYISDCFCFCLQKMLIALFNLICNTQKSKWTFFWMPRQDVSQY